MPRSGLMHSPIPTVCFLLVAMSASAVAITGREILSATGIKSGLCLHVGVGDGTITTGLDNDGKILVQGLATSREQLEQARAAVALAGKDGIVSIQVPLVRGRLPYARYLADLVVADLDALGESGPPMDELMRVTRPGGVLYLRRGGEWAGTVRPAVEGMDSEWRFEEGSEQRTNVSRDYLAGPATSLQWIADYGWVHGNHGPNVRGIRLSAGRVFYHCFTDKLDRKRYMHGRNAFNGVSLWKYEDGRMHLHSPLVPVGDRVYTVLENGKNGYTSTDNVTYGGPMVALDAESGEQVASYDRAGLADGFGQSMSPIVWDGTLYLINRDTLFAFDEKSGSLKWTFTEGSWRRPSRPVIDPDHKQIIMTIGPNSVGDRGGWFAGRWPNSKFDAIVAVGFDGRVRWRKTSLSSDRGKWDVLFPVKGPRGEDIKAKWDTTINYARKHAAGTAYAEGKFFVAMLMDNKEFGSMGAVSASDGKLLWHHISGYTFNAPLQLAYRAGVLYRIHYNCIIAIDPNTGYKVGPSADDLMAKSDFTGDQWANCSRTTLTPNYIITSSSAFYRNDRSWLRQYVHRGPCAQQGYPGNGMVYYPSGACHCAAYQRGFAALSSEPVAKPVDDKLRLIKGTAHGRPVSGSGLHRNADPWGLPVFALETPTAEREGMAALRSPPVKTGRPLRDDWISNDAFYLTKQSVTDNQGRTYTTHIHEHRLEAAAGGNVVWSFKAGSRISGAPLVWEGRCLFGAHDGWVYCLRASDGALVWKFLAAPYERNIVAYSQVESAWPVYGIVVHDSALYASAGRHPELNGGIWVYRLDPKTGAMAWKSVLARSGTWRDNGVRGPYRAPGKYASVKNTVPVIVDNQLAVKSARFDLGTGKMAPHVNPEFVNTPFTGTLAETRSREARPHSDVPIALDNGVFTVGSKLWVELAVFDFRGRMVAVLFPGDVSKGRHRYSLADMGLTAGRYTLRMSAEGQSVARAILVW